MDLKDFIRKITSPKVWNNETLSTEDIQRRYNNIEGASLLPVIQNFDFQNLEDFLSNYPDNFQKVREDQWLAITSEVDYDIELVEKMLAEHARNIRKSSQRMADLIVEVFECNKLESLTIEELNEKLKQLGLDLSEKQDALEELKHLKQKKPISLQYLQIDEKNRIVRYIVTEHSILDIVGKIKYTPRNSKMNAASGIVEIFESNRLRSLPVEQLLEKLKERGVDMPTAKYGDIGSFKGLQEAKPKTLRYMRIDEENRVVHYDFEKDSEMSPEASILDDYVVITHDQVQDNESTQSEKQNSSE